MLWPDDLALAVPVVEQLISCFQVYGLKTYGFNFNILVVFLFWAEFPLLSRVLVLIPAQLGGWDQLATGLRAEARDIALPSSSKKRPFQRCQFEPLPKVRQINTSSKQTYLDLDLKGNLIM